MKALVVAQQKGGAGKSTLALNLAVAALAMFKRVRVLDADPQATLVYAGERRRGQSIEAPEIIAASLGAVPELVEAARKDKIDLLVIDTPPHAGLSITAALRVADFVVIPVRPNPFDLDALPESLDRLREAQAPAAIVLNQVPPRSSRADAAKAYLLSEVLGDYEHVSVAPTHLTMRVDVSDAQIMGLGVLEGSPKSPAASEMVSVWAFIAKEMKRGR